MNARFLGQQTTRSGLVFLLLLSPAVLSIRAQQPTPDQSAAQAQASSKPSEPAAPTAHLERTPEDFSTITLDKSELKAFPPALGSVIRKEKFTEDCLQVQWRSYDPIDLYVVKPVGVEKPPVIIYLYGYPSGIAAFGNEAYMERVTSGGYAAVGFIGALTGPRFRMRPMKQTFLTELHESIATTVHDVQMVLNYLETRGDLDMTRVGLFGTGSGATIAILAAAADPRVKAVEAIEPWGDWPKWLGTTNQIPPSERAPYLKPEFLARVAPLDPVKWLPKLTTQKVQLQFIDTDDALAKEAKADIEAAVPKTVEVRHFENRGQHMNSSLHGKLFDWLKGQLQSQPPSPQQARALGPGNE
jgi:dienelactone hydrolase